MALSSGPRLLDSGSQLSRVIPHREMRRNDDEFGMLRTHNTAGLDKDSLRSICQSRKRKKKKALRSDRHSKRFTQNLSSMAHSYPIMFNLTLKT